MNPGSDEALDNGCLCPVLDNGHGKKKDGLFWMNADCPIHDIKNHTASEKPTQTDHKAIRQPSATKP